jgi:YidC/Oxa1 family membrane protein insertase
MKQKQIKLIILVLLIFILTGCTKPLKNEANKIIKNEKTGQNLTANIFCRPTEKDVLKVYEENKVNINKLPKCEEFKINSGGYEGIWTTVFVKPLAFLMIKIGLAVNNYGLSLILSAILIRLLLIPITKKSAVQSENMKNAQPELQKIEKKYKDKKDQENLMKKSQETLFVYKKYDINPLYGCLFAFIQLPLLFAFLEAINRVPALFEGKFLSLHLGTTPSAGISQGNILYIILTILIIVTTYFSFKLTSASANKEEQMQKKFMLIFMIGFITLASFNFPTAISLYWITASIFTIIQNLLVKRSKKNGNL